MYLAQSQRVVLDAPKKEPAAEDSDEDSDDDSDDDSGEEEQVTEKAVVVKAAADSDEDSDDSDGDDDDETVFDEESDELHSDFERENMPTEGSSHSETLPNATPKQQVRGHPEPPAVRLPHA